ncbi:hypothetical protein HUJ05_009026 [Dendroctonus ponderosae]|nr:hypothetical protein HUJ05_009026 [Dendroctonus ponderosae]
MASFLKVIGTNVPYMLITLKGRPGFQCNKCLKVYSQPGNLNRHEKYECQKSYRFLCDLCNYKCFRNNVLILHKSKKHGVVPPKRLTPSDDSELVDWSVQVPDLQQKLQILQRTQKASEGMRSGEAINLHVLSAQNPPQRKPADAHDNEAWRDADLNSYQTRPLPSSACYFPSQPSNPESLSVTDLVHYGRVCFRDGRNMPGLACPKCGNKFTRIDNLKRHINYICGMKPQFKCVYSFQYPCEMCGRTYQNKSSLKRHKRLECGVEPKYQCPWCFRKFKHEHHLEQHRNAKIKCTEGKPKMNDMKTDDEFWRLHLFENHVHDLHGIVSRSKPWYSCEFCFLDSLQHTCTKCMKQYKYKWNLFRHLKYECGVAPQFVCKLCSKAFTQKSSLKNHVAYVHGYQLIIKLMGFVAGKPAISITVCSVAIVGFLRSNRQFSYAAVSVLGFVFHENFFWCKVCHKKYKHRRNLLRHTKYECQKPPQFKCEICFVKVMDKFNCVSCNKVYKHQTSLKKHVRYECNKKGQFQCSICQSRKAFQCTICSKKFIYKYNLNHHIKYKCNKPPQFGCLFCHRRFTSKFGLKSHMCSSQKDMDAKGHGGF